MSFEPGMKQWMCDGGWEWWADGRWIRECDIISRVFYARRPKRTLSKWMDPRSYPCTPVSIQTMMASHCPTTGEIIRRVYFLSGYLSVRVTQKLKKTKKSRLISITFSEWIRNLLLAFRISVFVQYAIIKSQSNCSCNVTTVLFYSFQSSVTNPRGMARLSCPARLRTETVYSPAQQLPFPVLTSQ